MTLALILARLLSADPAIDLTSLHCMAEMNYFEARGEPVIGQIAVMQVAMRRTHDPRYPSTVCGVVHQRGQFEYYWDGKSETIHNRDAWNESLLLGAVVMLGWLPDVTNGATHFHSTGVKPAWSTGHPVTIGRHRFLAEVR